MQLSGRAAAGSAVLFVAIAAFLAFGTRPELGRERSATRTEPSPTPALVPTVTPTPDPTPSPSPFNPFALDTTGEPLYFTSHPVLHLDPGGRFAWLKASRTREPGKCEHIFLVRLAIEHSMTEVAHLTAIDEFVNSPTRVAIIEDGSAAAIGSCGMQRFKFDPDGSVTSVEALVTTLSGITRQTIYSRPHPFGASPDGRFRYTSGDDPLERLVHVSCRTQTGRRRAETLLRYEGADIAPAFRDLAVTGSSGRVEVSASGLIMWEEDSCTGYQLMAGRIDDEGYIVDRHLFRFAPLGHWVLTDDDEVIQVSVTPDGPRVHRIDATDSVGWVVTANPPVEIDPNPIVTGLVDDSTWHLGDNPSDHPCAGRTIYRTHPDGYRRVILPNHDIDGDIVDVVVSATGRGRQSYAALVTCAATPGQPGIAPDDPQNGGFEVWYGSYRPYVHESNQDRFEAQWHDFQVSANRASIGRVQSIESIDPPDANPGIRARVTFTDGRTEEVLLESS